MGIIWYQFNLIKETNDKISQSTKVLLCQAFITRAKYTMTLNMSFLELI